MPGTQEVREQNLASHHSKGFPAGYSCRRGGKPTHATKSMFGKVKGPLEGYVQADAGRESAGAGCHPTVQPHGMCAGAKLGMDSHPLPKHG